MEIVIPIMLLVANALALLSHLYAGETPYGGGERAFVLSSFGLLFVAISFIFLATVGTSPLLGVLVAASAGLSALGFLLFTMNASSGQG